MKKLWFAAIAMITCVAIQSAQAQLLQGNGLADTFAKIFGSTSAFTAQAELEIKTPDGRGDMKAKFKMAALEGNFRNEVDIANLQGGPMTPEMIATLQMMGVDQIVNIVHGEKKIAYIIYPALRSYMEQTLPAEQAAELAGAVKVEKTEIGREEVDGHPCIKNKVTVISTTGRMQEFTTWNALDLKDFPIRMETTHGGSKITSQFKNINLEKPAESLFEAPTGFTKYRDMQEMMGAVMQRMMGGGQ